MINTNKNEIEDLKNYEVKLKTTEKFDELFKIRMAVEGSENFDPVQSRDDRKKLRMELLGTTFCNLFADLKDSPMEHYEMFEVETVKSVQKKNFEVDVDLTTSVRVSVEAWDMSEAETVAEELIECDKECYADVYDLDVYTRDVREVV